MKPGELMQWLLFGALGYAAWELWNKGSKLAKATNETIFANVTAPAADAVTGAAQSVERAIGFARESLTGHLDLERQRAFKGSSGATYSITLAEAYRINTAPGRAKGYGSMSPISAADAAAYAQFVGRAIGAPADWRPR